MDIVTFAGSGRHVASWRSNTVTTDLVVAAVCEPQGMPMDQRPLVRQRDQRNLPTYDPQRTSAPRRWVS